MNQKYGIASLLPVVTFAAALGNAADATLEDHKITPSDVGALFGLAVELPTLARVDFGSVWPEALDVDAEEGKALENAFAKKLDLADDAFEGEAEEIFAATKDLALAAKRLAAVVSKAKARVLKGA
jgi:hypothetical protein